MSAIAATFSNTLWGVSCVPARRRLMSVLENPGHAQKNVLLGLLERNSSTSFGREHGLHKGMSVADFQNAVPIRPFDEFRPWIEKMKQGQPNVLCADPVLAFEKTSGSTAAAKYVPFTAGLRAEFQEAVRAWMGDLFHRHPAAMRGPAWWLVSPLRHPREATEGGIPVGLPGDDEYLGRCERRIASWLWAVPPSVGMVQDLDSSLDWTLRFLLQEEELRLISVWNPSLLLIIWQRFVDNREKFLNQLETGKGPEGPSILARKLKAMPARAKKLRWQSELSPKDVWPNLAVISSWADGEATGDAARTRTLFPGVIQQPKGLLATEGVVTIPWEDDEAAGVPALNSHFLEFVEPSNGAVRLVHELEEGCEYEALLTTSGGLWRYRLGDLVRVEGRAKSSPRLRWVGRCDDVCDLRGEKLNPQFVANVLQDSCEGFRMLAPHRDPNLPHYILFTSGYCEAGVVDAALQSNPHYAHARRVGQLGPLRVFRIRDQHPEEAYLRRCVSVGQRAGTIKPVALHRASGWETWFQGDFANLEK